jgi:hypothetical protein
MKGESAVGFLVKVATPINPSKASVYRYNVAKEREFKHTRV